MPMRFARLLAAMLFVAGGAFFSAALAANLDEACGGKEAITCNSALWCHKAGGQCEAADAPGKCEKAPTFCMRVSRPVCGCNGKTYANDCERQRVKVQLDHAGACKKEEPPRPAPAKKKGKG